MNMEGHRGMDMVMGVGDEGGGEKKNEGESEKVWIARGMDS